MLPVIHISRQNVSVDIDRVPDYISIQKIKEFSNIMHISKYSSYHYFSSVKDKTIQEFITRINR